MTAFIIFAIALTFIYIVYYSVIITIDLNAKPKNESSETETIDNGFDDTAQEGDDTDDSPYTEAHERQEEEQRQQEDETPEVNHHCETVDNVQDDGMGADEESSTSVPEQTSYDDDIYGIGDGDNVIENDNGESDNHSADDNPLEPETLQPEVDASVLIAQQQGAEIVEPIEIDETDYSKSPEKEIEVTIYEASPEAEMTASYLSNTGEPIMAESTTPITENHAENMLSMLGIERKANYTKF